MSAPEVGTWYARTEGQDVFSMQVTSVDDETVVFVTWRNVNYGDGLIDMGLHSVTRIELDFLLEEGEWVFLAAPAAEPEPEPEPAPEVPVD